MGLSRSTLYRFGKTHMRILDGFSFVRDKFSAYVIFGNGVFTSALKLDGLRWQDVKLTPSYYETKLGVKTTRNK